MSNPWDVPSLPSTGDEDINATYNGIGRIISGWEGIEVNLSRIFCMFHAKPDDYEIMQKYGGPTKFIHRFGELQQIARTFFVRRHNQEIEGTLDKLADRINGFSNRRNDIAHGIVTVIQVYPWFIERAASIKPRTNYFAVMPPYHDYKKHSDMGGHTPLKRMPAFVYTSREMLTIDQHLSELYGELSNYREKLRVFLSKP